MARRLVAILYYDAVDFNLAMGRDEARSLEGLKSDRREIIDTKVGQYGGRTIKLMGDGALLEFASAVEAVTFAVGMQCSLADRNAKLPEDQQRCHRIGINIGDVTTDGGDIYGDSVNIASRLETLAGPGGICIHRNVRGQLGGKLDIDFEDLGEVEAKNIERPVRAFRVVLNEKAAAIAALPIEKTSKLKSPTRFWRAMAGIFLALTLVAGFVWWQFRSPEFEPVDPSQMAQPLPAKPSIAVLALDDLSTGEDNDYLGDAVSEGIITELARFSEFFVIARNSSFKFRGRAIDVREIARDLGVQYILDGSQRKVGDQIRISVQLIDALAGNNIWSESYDRPLSDFFVVQSEIVRTVSATVGFKIAYNSPPENGSTQFSALHYHLQGRKHIRAVTREDTETARILNQKAIEADQNSPYGYFGMAFVYRHLNNHGWSDEPSQKLLGKAAEYADQALELSPENYAAHHVRGRIHIQSGELDQAIIRLKNAIKLNPSTTPVIMALTNVLVYQGNPLEAVQLARDAMRIDPYHPNWFHWDLAWSLWALGECKIALQEFNKMAKIPNRALLTRAAIEVCINDLEAGRETIDTFLLKAPDYTLEKDRNIQAQKYVNQADLSRWSDMLRKAGLPET